MERDGERYREIERELWVWCVNLLNMCFCSLACFFFVCLFRFLCLVVLFSCRFRAPAVVSLCLLSGFLCLVLCVVLCVVAGCLFHSICHGNRFSLSNSRFQTAVVYD